MVSRGLSDRCRLQKPFFSGQKGSQVDKAIRMQYTHIYIYIYIHIIYVVEIVFPKSNGNET